MSNSVADQVVMVGGPWRCRYVGRARCGTPNQADEGSCAGVKYPIRTNRGSEHPARFHHLCPATVPGEAESAGMHPEREGVPPDAV